MSIGKKLNELITDGRGREDSNACEKEIDVLRGCIIHLKRLYIQLLLVDLCQLESIILDRKC